MLYPLIFIGKTFLDKELFKLNIAFGGIYITNIPIDVARNLNWGDYILLGWYNPSLKQTEIFGYFKLQAIKPTFPSIKSEAKFQKHVVKVQSENLLEVSLPIEGREYKLKWDIFKIKRTKLSKVVDGIIRICEEEGYKPKNIMVSGTIKLFKNPLYININYTQPPIAFIDIPYTKKQLRSQ